MIFSLWEVIVSLLPCQLKRRKDNSVMDVYFKQVVEIYKSNEKIYKANNIRRNEKVRIWNLYDAGFQHVMNDFLQVLA